MNVLDENVPVDQRQLLRRWRIRVRHIGHDIGRPGMSDEDIIPLLRQLHRPTLFTRDQDFYSRRLCHASSCLVYLVIDQDHVAAFVRQVLRHPAFNTQAKRRGSLLRVSPTAIHVLRLLGQQEDDLPW